MGDIPDDAKVVIIRMRLVSFMDQSGLYAMETAIKELQAKGIMVLMTIIQPQPMYMLKTMKLIPEVVPEEHTFATFEDCTEFLKGLKMFSSDHTYFVRFSDVSGLSANSPVYANGYKIGVVQGIDYNYQHPDCIIATIGVTKEMLLPQGTQAEITSDLLGNVKLELRLGDIAAMRLAPGDTINGGQQVGVMGKAADMIPQIEQMLPKLDSIVA